MTYPDLQHEVAERVHPPGFDEVLSRAAAARRRRRTTVGAGLAAGLAVAGLAVAVGDPGGADRRSGEPAAPTVTWDGASSVDPRLPADVREVLGMDRLQHWSVSGSDDATAVVWSACDDGPGCRFALVTRRGDEVEGEVLDVRGPASLAPVPGGWWWQDEDGGSRLTLTGDREPVVDVGGAGTTDVQPGDTAVATVRGWRILRGTELLPLPSPADAAIDSAYVTPSGRLVVATARGEEVAVRWSDDGVTWAPAATQAPRAAVATSALAGHGEAVALVLLGDDADGSVPLVGVHVSAHAGAPFVPAVGLDLEGADGIRDLSAVAVSDEGTAFLSTGSHGVVRAETDGSTTVDWLSPQDSSVFTVDDRVCLVAESGRIDHLQCSADDGASWEGEPLPGFR